VPTVGTVEKTLLRKIAEKVGLAPEEIEEIQKGERVTLADQLDVLRDGLTKAYLAEEVDGDAVTAACRDFTAWAEEVAKSMPVEKAERAEALGVEVDAEGSTQETRTTEDEMSFTDQERQEFDDLKKQVEELPQKVSAQLAKALGAKVEDEAEPTPESVAKA